MKILLVIERESTKEAIIDHFLPLGFSFIHYMNPIKAMDNIDEIDPEIVIFSAEDFPRHWKPFICLLRESERKTEEVFILLSGNSFTDDEANKAAFLKVSGIIHEDLQDREELDRIEELISRKFPLKSDREYKRHFISPGEKLEFVFTHPLSLKLITGKIFDISAAGISFNPDNPQLTADIKEGENIPLCSLQMGEEIFSFTCRVNRNNTIIGFSFADIDSSVELRIMEFIDKKGERALSERLRG